MSWRDNSSSSNRSSTNDGSGGSRDGGGNVHGTGSGSGSGGGGGLTGRAGRAIAAALKNQPRIQPLSATPITTPPIVSPVPPVSYPPVGGPPTRVDLNPATLAPWTGVGLTNYNSTFPARPGVSPRIGVENKDQSRLPGMGLMNGGFGQRGRSGGPRSTQGGVGGGFGGGGGGGW